MLDQHNQPSDDFYIPSLGMYASECKEQVTPEMAAKQVWGHFENGTIKKDENGEIVLDENGRVVVVPTAKDIEKGKVGKRTSCSYKKPDTLGTLDDVLRRCANDTSIKRIPAFLVGPDYSGQSVIDLDLSKLPDSKGKLHPEQQALRDRALRLDYYVEKTPSGGIHLVGACNPEAHQRLHELVKEKKDGDKHPVTCEINHGEPTFSSTELLNSRMWCTVTFQNISDSVLGLLNYADTDLSMMLEIVETYEAQAGAGKTKRLFPNTPEVQKIVTEAGVWQAWKDHWDNERPDRKVSNPQAMDAARSKVHKPTGELLTRLCIDDWKAASEHPHFTRLNSSGQEVADVSRVVAHLLEAFAFQTKNHYEQTMELFRECDVAHESRRSKRNREARNTDEYIMKNIYGLSKLVGCRAFNKDDPLFEARSDLPGDDGGKITPAGERVYAEAVPEESTALVDLPSLDNLPRFAELNDYINSRMHFNNETLAQGGALAAISCVVGSTYIFQGNMLNLFVLGLGDTCMGKSDVTTQVGNLYDAVEQEVPFHFGPMTDKIVSGPALRKMITNRNPCFGVTGDEGVKKLNRWMGGTATEQGVLDELLTFWNCQKKGKDTYSTDGKEYEQVNNPALTLFLAGNNGEMFESLDFSHFRSGAIGRFLFLEHPPKTFNESKNRNRITGVPTELQVRMSRLAMQANINIQKSREAQDWMDTQANIVEQERAERVEGKAIKDEGTSGNQRIQDPGAKVKFPSPPELLITREAQDMFDEYTQYNMDLRDDLLGKGTQKTVCSIALIGKHDQQAMKVAGNVAVLEHDYQEDFDSRINWHGRLPGDAELADIPTVNAVHADYAIAFVKAQFQNQISSMERHGVFSGKLAQEENAAVDFWGTLFDKHPRCCLDSSRGVRFLQKPGVGAGFVTSSFLKATMGASGKFDKDGRTRSEAIKFLVDEGYLTEVTKRSERASAFTKGVCTVTDKVIVYKIGRSDEWANGDYEHLAKP